MQEHQSDDQKLMIHRQQSPHNKQPKSQDNEATPEKRASENQKENQNQKTKKKKKKNKKKRKKRKKKKQQNDKTKHNKNQTRSGTRRITR